MSEGWGSIPMSAGGVSPPAVSGLIIWLDADQISGKVDGDPVTVWPDMSGFANDADASGAPTPTYKVGIINGNPVVRFGPDSAATGSYLITPAPHTASVPGTVFIVLKTTLDPNPTSNMGLWDFGTSGSAGAHYPYTDSVVYDDAGSNVRKTLGDPGPSLTSPRIYCVRSAPNDWSAFLDGAAFYADTSVNVSWGNWRIGISRGGFFWIGDIGELLFYDTALSPTDRIIVETYLKAKWGIP